MAKLEEKVASIEVRCSPQARVLLNNLRFDSFYPKLIQTLRMTQGELSYRDIEDAFILACYAKRSRSVPENKSSGILKETGPRSA